jgi:hypothetical protein
MVVKPSSAATTEVAVSDESTERVLLTPGDVERVYGIPKSTQAKNRMAGTFAPFVKRGRSVYVLKSDLDAWLASLKRQSTIDPNYAP